MTTTHEPDIEMNAFDAEMQAKIDATLSCPGVSWRAYGEDSEGHKHFVTFGTPEVYSRDSVRNVAERLFERHTAKPSLIAIRPAAKKGCNWVPKGRISGKVSAAKNGLGRY